MNHKWDKEQLKNNRRQAHWKSQKDTSKEEKLYFHNVDDKKGIKYHNDLREMYNKKYRSLGNYIKIRGILTQKQSTS